LKLIKCTAETVKNTVILLGINKTSFYEPATIPCDTNKIYYNRVQEPKIFYIVKIPKIFNLIYSHTRGLK